MDNVDVQTVDSPVMSRISFVYEVRTEVLEQPDRIKNVTITLPNGMTAKFIRSGDWVSRS
jgi:hypothetical protein